MVGMRIGNHQLVNSSATLPVNLFDRMYLSSRFLNLILVDTCSRNGNYVANLKK